MKRRTYILHALLAVLTLLSLCIAGVQWSNQDPFELSNLAVGLTYSCCIFSFLAVHEFGHYLAARYHETEASLPYFLPFPSFLGLAPFGTLGAVIKLTGQPRDRNALFDIAAFGPIAGFLTSVVFVCWGFATLPEKSYLFSIHPEYSELKSLPSGGLTFGYSIAFSALEKIIPHASSFVPPMNEIYHYPFLCAGWFGMFVTGLNLLPVGQLDGGHLAFCLVPTRNRIVSTTTLLLLGILGTLGAAELLWPAIHFGWIGWLVWTLVLAISLRSRIGYSRVADIDLPLTRWRRLVGLVTLTIFVISFIPIPVSM
jgi:membrane-associated protease RseP (regulator of RpoE activity)